LYKGHLIQKFQSLLRPVDTSSKPLTDNASISPKTTPSRNHKKNVSMFSLDSFVLRQRAKDFLGQANVQPMPVPRLQRDFTRRQKRLSLGHIDYSKLP
jgi:hypothetical protein